MEEAPLGGGAVNINCDQCGVQLKEPGYLFFTPPWDGRKPKNSVLKYHLCTDCGTVHEATIVNGKKAP